MNWEAWQAVGELVAALGVVFSLLYLAAQVRQNTQSMQAATNQQLMSNFSDIVNFATSGPDGARVYRTLLDGKWERLSDDEQAVMRMTWVRVLRLFEHAHQQYHQGLLAEGVWRGWSNQIQVSVATPGCRLVWPGVRTLLGSQFVEWVEEVLTLSAPEAAREYYAGVPPSELGQSFSEVRRADGTSTAAS